MTNLQALRKLESVQYHLLNSPEMRKQFDGPSIWTAIYDVDRFRRDFKYGNKCAICRQRSDSVMCESCKQYYQQDGRFHA